jgi:hypothetical protein
LLTFDTHGEFARPSSLLCLIFWAIWGRDIARALGWLPWSRAGAIGGSSWKQWEGEMLSQGQLTDALHTALKEVNPPCGRFCTADASVEEVTYVVHHNGIGNRSTDVQKIYNGQMLSLVPTHLAAKLQAWIEGLHRGEKIDLNATMDD